uniref:Uncharacterized protein n=1 Tax=Anguilla anguilla TaxID=7936 RepID=A0A0E9R5A1_ANGAN
MTHLGHSGWCAAQMVEETAQNLSCLNLS